MIDDYTIYCTEEEQLTKLMRYIECPEYQAALLCSSYSILIYMVHELKARMPVQVINTVYYTTKIKAFIFESGAIIQLVNMQHRDSVHNLAGYNCQYVAFVGFYRIRDYDHEYMLNRLRQCSRYELPLELTITQ